MRRHVLVFDDGNGAEVDLGAFVDALDDGAQMYTLDGHACFVMTELSVNEVSDRFLKFAGSSLYFIADVSTSDCSGRMLGRFWDFIKLPELSSAAE